MEFLDDIAPIEQIGIRSRGRRRQDRPRVEDDAPFPIVDYSHLRFPCSITFGIEQNPMPQKLPDGGSHHSQSAQSLATHCSRLIVLVLGSRPEISGQHFARACSGVSVGIGGGVGM